jgi:hypothetical protein
LGPFTFEERRDYSSDAAIEAQENSGAACHYVSEVDWNLATTIQTTLAGVAAVLRFANEIEDAGLEWPNTDEIGPDGWHYQLRATMAAAIESADSARPTKPECRRSVPTLSADSNVRCAKIMISAQNA